MSKRKSERKWGGKMNGNKFMNVNQWKVLLFILCLHWLQWIKYAISLNSRPLRSICITIIRSVV